MANPQEYAKRAVKRRAVGAVMREANIDTTGMDPEMMATLAPEAARRLGAAGVQLQTKNPLKWLTDLFKRKSK